MNDHLHLSNFLILASYFTGSVINPWLFINMRKKKEHGQWGSQTERQNMYLNDQELINWKCTEKWEDPPG